jgi:TPR repeat protein
MAKSLRNINNRKRSVTRRRQFAGKPSKQETLYNDGLQLYKEFQSAYKEYYDNEGEQQYANKAQRLLKECMEKFIEAVNNTESDEITMRSAFLIYSCQVDDDAITYDMYPEESAKYLKIAADLGHPKACFLYSQLSDDLIDSNGYSSTSVAKEAYFDKALSLKNPNAMVSHAYQSVTIDSLNLLFEAFECYKYMEISDTDSNLILGFNKHEIKSDINSLKEKVIVIFRDLIDNEYISITKNVNAEKKEEFMTLFNNYKKLSDYEAKIMRIYHELTDEEIEAFQNRTESKYDYIPKLFEILYELHKNNKLTTQGN